MAPTEIQDFMIRLYWKYPTEEINLLSSDFIITYGTRIGE
jgi:hypothetical protein